MPTTAHAGSAHLTFTRSGPATVLTRAFAASPAKLIATNGHGTTCWVYAATLRRRACRRRRDSPPRGRYRWRARVVDDAGVDEGVSIAPSFAPESGGICGRRCAPRRGAGSDRVFCGRGLHADAAIRPASAMRASSWWTGSHRDGMPQANAGRSRATKAGSTSGAARSGSSSMRSCSSRTSTLSSNEWADSTCC